MARQSLIGQFLSSTIRQVGRDTGKVISNQLFGDAHSTPVRHIKSETPSSNLPKPKTVKEILEEQRKGTYKPYTYTPEPRIQQSQSSRYEKHSEQTSEWKGFGCFLAIFFVVVFVVVLVFDLLTL